ncbi:MAG: cell wall hydrolase [Geminicoccaceae bacterium]
MRWGSMFAAGVLLGLCGLVGEAKAAPPADRDRRCLAMIAYAEAANEGALGMLAVMRVVHNRIADRSFADDACAVVLQRGQFQPVSEQPSLRQAMARPETANLAQAVGANTREARLRLVEAWRLAAVAAVWPARDPTGGALYFVNPRLMNPDLCPWFAKLKRSAVIGEHVFMRDYGPGEAKAAPALACARAAAARSPAPRPATRVAAR